MAKLRTIEDGKAVYFWCPGCQRNHMLHVNGNRNSINAGWTWNGSFDAPTLSPSILQRESPRCHSFVKSGMIEFLNDCEHSLAGKTIVMEEAEA